MATTSVVPPGGEGTRVQVDSAPPAADQEAQRRRAKKEVWLRVTVWFALSVLAGLIPTISQYLNGRQTAGFQQPSFWEWVSRAQLYPVAMTLAIASVGEALMQLRKKHSFRLILVIINNLVVTLFATILVPTTDSADKIKEVVGQQSLMVFIAALLGSGLCTWICATQGAEEVTVNG